jgi:rubrerythrin
LEDERMRKLAGEAATKAPVWICPECDAENEGEAEECNVCEEPKPA